jgi:hypothetical protein
MKHVAALVVVALHALLASCASSTAAGPVRAQGDGFSRDPWGWEADDGWNERAAFHMAQREFRDGSIGDGDDHFGLGLELAGEPYDAWIGLEFGLFTSSSLAQWSRWGPVFSGLDDDDLDIGAAESRSFELSLGAHKEVRPFGGPVALTFGSGAALLELEEAELDVTFTSDDDADIGWYGHFGIHYVLAAPGRIGIDVRMLEGTEHELSGRTLSGDYRQIAFVFSFYF